MLGAKFAHRAPVSPDGILPCGSACLFLRSCLHHCYLVVMHLLREIYSAVLLGENVHIQVLPFNAYTHYH